MSITQISVNKQVLCLFLLQQGCFRLNLHQNASVVMRSSKKLSSSLLLKKSIRRLSQTPGTRSKLQKKSCLPLSLRRYKSNCNRSSIRASCRNKNNTLLENIKIETCLKNAAENILKEWRAYPVDTLLEAGKSAVVSEKRLECYHRFEKFKFRRTSLSSGLSFRPINVILKGDVRIPLAWKNKDHFLNKGDSRSYAVFALCEIGDDIYDTRLVSHVDRTFTDIQFEETFVFRNVPAEFNLVITLYSRLISNGEDYESVENVKNKVLKPISRSLSRGPSIHRKKHKALSCARFCQVASVILNRSSLTPSGSVVTNLILNENFQEFVPPNFGFLCCDICINVNSKSKFTFDGYLTVQNNSGNYESVRCILRRVKLYIYWSNGLQTVNITADCTFTWETLKFILTTVSGDVLVFTSCEVDVLEQFYRTLIHHRQENVEKMVSPDYLCYMASVRSERKLEKSIGNGEEPEIDDPCEEKVSSEELNDGKKEEAVPPASPKVAAKRLIILGEAASDVISVTSDPIDPKQSNPAISAINTELLIGVSENGFFKTSRSRLDEIICSEKDENEKDEKLHRKIVSRVHTAFSIQKSFNTFASLLHGILTGFSLFHCLCVFAAAETSVISVNFLNYYTHISLPIHSLYFGIVAICTVAILDNYDISHALVRILNGTLRAVNLLPGVFVVLTHFVIMVMCLMVLPIEEHIWIQGLNRTSSESATTTTTAPDNGNAFQAALTLEEFSIWKYCILFRTTLLCLTWLFVNLRHESNTLLDLLGKPTVEVVDDNDKTKSDISR
ncbi:Rhotekin-2 [Trichinella nelsoni]|uniref:Rhotekin-2 n=1 Tax=Trichinella nelsoni TaxID=6336 RepID=A0A0V0SG62_9BILA|nr:Rhotekin-2 [Trichinella nelsoni]